MEDLRLSLDEHISGLSEGHKFSGSVLVALNGEVILNKGCGMANYELDVPNTPRMIFRIGSVTKQFTALAVMQLSEQRLLDPTDTINKYLPDYPSGDKITVHQLLSHRAGIWNYTDSPNF